ncbi:hypothetical protein V5F31_13070 [Xanthobacter sp. V7C-4]|uniref:hypothetical protein n=1 Tax=Xanthobacter autotrophicus (strain ATCC BAA-1158 / Py2) TaxID=78245 RepID=UPI00372CD61F
MSDPQVLTTLRRKRAEVEGFIAKLEKQIDTAKRDLSAINATIRIFEVNGEPREFPAYVEIHRLFKRGEMTTICKAALAQEGPLDTRELALRVIRAKDLDEGDKALRQTIALRIVQALRLQERRGFICDNGRRNGVRVWSR